MSSSQPVLAAILNGFKPLSENLIKHKVRAKYVPDFVRGGYRLAQVCSFDRPVFMSSGFEERRDKSDKVSRCEDEVSELLAPMNENNVQRAIRRSRSAVFDLCICNNFDLFCTFTYSSEYIDRSNYEEAYRKIKVWLSNRVQRHGLHYVAAPEYHKKGKAIHFHALCNSSAVNLVDSGHKRKGKTVYNIGDWKWGFSTAIKIEGESALEKTSKYIAKYMTKQGGAKIGGRYYLSGGELNRPTYVYGDSFDEFITTETPTYEKTYDLGFTIYKEASFL